MTTGAIKILSIRAHMNVKFLVGFHQGGIQVTMLDPVSAATEKVTGAAVFAGRPAHALGDLIPVRRMIRLVVTFENLGFVDRVSRAGREFFIGARLFVTDQAIHFGLIGKVEILIFPSITRMT